MVTIAAHHPARSRVLVQAFGVPMMVLRMVSTASRLRAGLPPLLLGFGLSAALAQGAPPAPPAAIVAPA
ncbi:hypothetical protein ACFQ12_01820, partial [Methylobacterium trifolii]